MGNRLMTWEEKEVILDAIYAANRAGNEDEAQRLMIELPLAPGMAQIAKELYGKEYLIENGYNLSEANMEFGDDWLNE